MPKKAARNVPAVPLPSFVVEGAEVYLRAEKGDKIATAERDSTYVGRTEEEKQYMKFMRESIITLADKIEKIEKGYSEQREQLKIEKKRNAAVAAKVKDVYTKFTLDVRETLRDAVDRGAPAATAYFAAMVGENLDYIPDTDWHWLPATIAGIVLTGAHLILKRWGATAIVRTLKNYNTAMEIVENRDKAKIKEARREKNEGKRRVRSWAEMKLRRAYEHYFGLKLPEVTTADEFFALDTAKETEPHKVKAAMQARAKTLNIGNE